MLVATRRIEARTDSPDQAGAAPPSWAYLVTPGIALVAITITVLWGSQYGLGLRDPDGVIGRRLVLLLALILAFWAGDVVPARGPPRPPGVAAGLGLHPR